MYVCPGLAQQPNKLGSLMTRHAASHASTIFLPLSSLMPVV